MDNIATYLIIASAVLILGIVWFLLDSPKETPNGGDHNSIGKE